MNQHESYLSETSIQTHTRRIALPAPLKLSVKIQVVGLVDSVKI